MKKNFAVFQTTHQLSREIAPGFHARFLHSDSSTVAFVNVDAGSSIPAHDHPHEQVTHLLNGRLELLIDDEVVVLNDGDAIVIPPHTSHGATAITDCTIIDVFVPCREDYK